MKIVHIITRMVAGGAQRNTLMCALEQAQSGHQVTLISGLQTGSEGSLLEEARQAPFRFVQMPALVREVAPAQDLKALLQLTTWLRRSPVDIVHTHTSKAGLLGRLAAAAAGVPIVVHTPHGHVFHSYFSPLKTRLFKLLEKSLAHFTDALVMLSAGELQDHLDEGICPPQRMYVIPSGVSLEAFRRCQHAELERPRLGYIGRLADIKGPLDLIEAMSHVPDEVELWMVGDGPQREEVERRIRDLQLGSRIRLLGWQHDIPHYLEQIDVLVVPSHNEGMGRVAVEALAAGVPVVATRVGGLVDVVRPGVNGALAPEKDPAGLARAIASVLEQPDRGRALGEQGRSWAEQFSDEVMYQRLEQLYARMARLKGVPLADF